MKASPDPRCVVTDERIAIIYRAAERRFGYDESSADAVQDCVAHWLIEARRLSCSSDPRELNREPDELSRIAFRRAVSRTMRGSEICRPRGRRAGGVYVDCVAPRDAGYAVDFAGETVTRCDDAIPAAGRGRRWIDATEGVPHPALVRAAAAVGCEPSTRSLEDNPIFCAARAL